MVWGQKGKPGQSFLRASTMCPISQMGKLMLWDWVTFKGKILDAYLLRAKVFSLFFGCGVGFVGF